MQLPLSLDSCAAIRTPPELLRYRATVCGPSWRRLAQRGYAPADGVADAPRVRRGPLHAVSENPLHGAAGIGVDGRMQPARHLRGADDVGDEAVETDGRLVQSGNGRGDRPRRLGRVARLLDAARAQRRYARGPKLGHRRLDRIRVSRTRVLRVMRAQGLLSPHRGRQGEMNAHDGTIVTSAPDVMWGTDGVRVFTADDGWVWTFAAVDHWNAECLGWHVCKVGNPETNGVVERWNRTLKEQAVYGRVFRNLADVRAAVAEFVERYNQCWRLEKLAYRTPLEAREEYELRHAA